MVAKLALGYSRDVRGATIVAMPGPARHVRDFRGCSCVGC